MRLLGHIFDIILTSLLFVLMIMGYCLYFLLFPFFRTKSFFKIGVGFILILTLGLVIAYTVFMHRAGQARTDKKPLEAILDIEKGATLNQITRVLQQSHIIDAPWPFKLLVLVKGASTELKAGRYKLNNRMSLKTLLDTLVKGHTHNSIIVVPEGYTSWQIASLLSHQMRVDSAAFIKLVYDKTFAQSLGIEGVSLEGYLFPDTYTFSWNATPGTIIRKMVHRFNEVYKKCYTHNDVTAKYGKREIVTMASIIEGEAMVAHERPLIAGVFYNRLAKGISLGADPTVRFALKKYGQPLTRRDLNVDSPYNTRVYTQLPPGPIGNPGASSLQAAIYPSKTNMLYFVAKEDGSREHYFTATNRQHVKMKQRARTNRSVRQDAGPALK